MAAQGERRAAESPRDPHQAGPGAIPRGLPGHPPHLPDRLHPLGQPVRGHPGRRAAAHQGEQGGGPAALHGRRGRLRLQEASPVSPRNIGERPAGTKRGSGCRVLAPGHLRLDPKSSSFGIPEVDVTRGGSLESFSSSSSVALPGASIRQCGSCCPTARSAS